MRRRALFISAAVLLLLGATVLAVSRLDLNRYRGQVQATLAERLRRDVSIGEMHVSFVPLGVRLDNSVIGEDPAFQTGRPFARADALYVSVSPLALLRGRIEVRAVKLRRPVIELVRNADGGWNVASIGTNRRSGGLVLKQIGVTGGEVAITNLATREKRRTVYRNIDLTLDDYAPDRPFHLVAAMKLPGTGDPRLTLRGEGGPLAGGRIAEAAFKGKLEIDAVVTGTADVALTANEAMLDHVAVALGSTKAQGRLTVRNFASPEIAFELSADTLDVGELQRLLGPARQAPSRQAGVGGDSVLLRTTGTGRLRADTIRHNKLLLENAQADVRFDRGVITLQPLTASLYGGTHRGSVLIDARGTPTAFTVDNTLDRVDANRLVSSTTNLDDVVQGALSSSNHLTFTTDGSGSVATSLNGTLSMTIPEGRIAHTDLKHAIRALVGFKGNEGDRQITNVRDFSAHFTVADGVAHTEDLAATLDDDSTISGTGSIDLVNQQLDLRLTAVLSREFSDRVGGRRVAGVMSTVLANEDGELVVPMLVSGTTRQPRFAPDMRAIAAMKVGDRLPKDPVAKMKEALGRILGGRRTKEQPAPKP